MNIWADIDYDYFYEFCLDWQMNVVDKEHLQLDFSLYGWDFEEFKERATKHNYWVASMELLRGSTK